MSLKGLNIEVVAGRIPLDVFHKDGLRADGTPAGDLDGLELPLIPRGSRLVNHSPAPLLKHPVKPTDNTGWGKRVRNVLALDLVVFDRWLDIALKIPRPCPHGD